MYTKGERCFLLEIGDGFEKTPCTHLALKIAVKLDIGEPTVRVWGTDGRAPVLHSMRAWVFAAFLGFKDTDAEGYRPVVLHVTSPPVALAPA